jgi:hypothetical protein
VAAAPRLTPQQEDDLLAGKWCFVVHCEQAIEPA